MSVDDAGSVAGCTSLGTAASVAEAVPGTTKAVGPGRLPAGMSHVVTAFLRHGGELLLTRRSDAVGSYAGRWAGVSGYVEGDPDDALADARREIREETGVTDPALVRAGDPLHVVDGDREWTVHPFLFEVDSRKITPNEELAAHEWVPAPEMRERETVPGLWEAYRRVGPTVETVAADRSHGSAYLSLRALEALRDAAAEAEDAESVAAVARDLRDAHPTMAALANRVNRVVAGGADPTAVVDRAHAVLRSAVDADDEAAAAAADLLDGPVLTLSRSGTALAAIRKADVPVVVAESRPGGEGVAVAEELAAEGRTVALTTDAAVAHLVGEGEVTAAVVGADTVLPDGSVVNKVGSRALGLACRDAGVPLYAVAARDKVSHAADPHYVEGEPGDVYGGDADLTVRNPVFDRTPASCLAAVVTEDGALDEDAIAVVAAEHEEAAGWDDS